MGGATDRGATDPGGASAARRVLVVDDEQAVARVHATLVGSFGHEVRTVFNGQDALRAAAEFRPDAVLLDIGLPDLDGYEVCRRLRAEPWGRHTRLIAVTGQPDEQRSRAAGFDAELTKPAKAASVRTVLE